MPTIADLRTNAKLRRGCAKIKRADFPGDTSEVREAAETLARAEEYTAGLLEWAAQEIEVLEATLGSLARAYDLSRHPAYREPEDERADVSELIAVHMGAARAELAKRKEDADARCD